MKKMGILVGIFVVFAFLLLGLMIAVDIQASKEYKNAERIIGTVIGQKEDARVSAYGSGPFGAHKKRYCQYEVEFWADGQDLKYVVQTKEKGLQPGEAIEVRYVRDRKTGRVIVVSRVFADRLRELIIGGTLGVVWAAVIIALKQKGLLD